MRAAFCKIILDTILKSAYDSGSWEIWASKCHLFLFGSFF